MNVLIEYTHRLATPVLIGLIGTLLVRGRGAGTGGARAIAWACDGRVRPAVRPGGTGRAASCSGAEPRCSSRSTWPRRWSWSDARLRDRASRGRWTLGAPAAAPTAMASSGQAPWWPRPAAGSTSVVLVGAYVRGEGAGLAFRDWPLMDGRLSPTACSAQAAGHMFLHRLLAAAAVPVVVWFAVRAWRDAPGASGARLFAFAALASACSRADPGGRRSTSGPAGRPGRASPTSRWPRSCGPPWWPRARWPASERRRPERA